MTEQQPGIVYEYHLNQHEPQKPQFAIHDLHAYVSRSDETVTRPQIHNCYQIIWFKSGTGKHFVDFKEYDVSDNVIFFIARNQVSYFNPGIVCQGILLCFNEVFLKQSNNDADYLLISGMFNSPYQQPSRDIGNSTNYLLDDYIQQIASEMQNGEKFGKEELLRTFLKSFLIQVQREANKSEKKNESMSFGVNEKRAQLTGFVNLIEEHYTKNLSVAEYAVMLHVSVRTLSNLTSDLLNKTPSLLIQERIILEAKRLLLYSGLNVNQVGYRLGFDDPSYFVKYFKKHTNISPSEFRKSVS